MNEQKVQIDYIAEAKRIADDIQATEMRISELDKEKETKKKYLEDLKIQYKEVFLRANLERLTAFRDECKKRCEKVIKQIDLIQNEKKVLRLQLKDEIDGRTYNDKVQEISKKMKKIQELYDTYFNNSIADLVGITQYDESIIRTFVSDSQKIDNDKQLTIEDVYQRRLEILSSPLSFMQKITQFSAGGLGATAYYKVVSVAELVRCWEYDEFKFVCPKCGATAYIYQFAGRVGAGGYWELTAYCPKCSKHLHYYKGQLKINPVTVHWSALARIASPIIRQIQKLKENSESGICRRAKYSP